MPIIFAVANQKGGCGKTTTTMNLAGALTHAGYRVLVIDADPQGSAMDWSSRRGQHTLPFEVRFSRQYRGDFSQLASLPDFDFVLVDCEPGVADPETKAKHTQQAIRQADVILIPLRPGHVDFDSAAIFSLYLEKECKSDQRVLVFVNGRKHNLLGREAAAQARVLFAELAGSVVLDAQIGDRTPITEVSGSGKTIFDYAPKSRAATEYFNLTKEILEWLQNAHPSPTTTSLPSDAPSPQCETEASL